MIGLRPGEAEVVPVFLGRRKGTSLHFMFCLRRCLVRATRSEPNRSHVQRKSRSRPGRSRDSDPSPRGSGNPARSLGLGPPVLVLPPVGDTHAAGGEEGVHDGGEEDQRRRRVERFLPDPGPEHGQETLDALVCAAVEGTENRSNRSLPHPRSHRPAARAWAAKRRAAIARTRNAAARDATSPRP